ncbi:MAG: single-stranded DNA-binding protein [Bacteroidia bacterium]
MAEQILQKGSEVVIDGKISTRNYTDKEGVKKYFTEIVANELLLINRKHQN